MQDECHPTFLDLYTSIALRRLCSLNPAFFFIFSCTHDIRMPIPARCRMRFDAGAFNLPPSPSVVHLYRPSLDLLHAACAPVFAASPPPACSNL